MGAPPPNPRARARSRSRCAGGLRPPLSLRSRPRHHIVAAAVKRIALPEVSRPLALIAGGVIALFFALWIRTGSMGLTCHLLSPPEGTDILAIEPADPIPAAIDLGRYVSPTADP